MDKEIIIQQYRKINKEADDIRELSINISKMESQLMTYWRGLETEPLYKELDEISYMLKKINADMVDFGHEYLKIMENIEKSIG